MSFYDIHEEMKSAKEDSLNYPFEFNFDEKQMDIGIHVYIASRHTILGLFSAY